MADAPADLPRRPGQKPVNLAPSVWQIRHCAPGNPLLLAQATNTIQ
jgi:hypothetical protein